MIVALADSARTDAWAAALRRALPAATVEPVESVKPAAVDYVVGWTLDAGAVAPLANLRGVLVTGAGYDHLDLVALPDVPLVRLADPAMADDIASYCLAWIIRYQRDFDVFAAAQVTGSWIERATDHFPRDVTVGVLGTGLIGSVVLDRCREYGAVAIGWSRSQHDRSLEEFFHVCDVVIDVLPATASTYHLVSRPLLQALGDGLLINVGRGATVDTDALLDVLDGPMRGAVLDVFETEPLPPESPLWRHPKVVITPHVAGRTDPATAAPLIAANVHRIESGGQPFPLIVREGSSRDRG